MDQELSKKYEYDREPGTHGDTDSCYVYLKPIIDKSGLKDTQEILEYVDKKVVPILEKIIKTKVLDDISYSRNLYNPSVMDMEREVIADNGIVVGKKNYALNVLDSEGIRYPKGKKKIVGLNIKKTNLPAFVRKKMLEFLDLLFAKSESNFQKEFKSFKNEFNALPISDISFPKGVSLYTDKNRPGIKKISETKFLYTLETSGCPIHVRASLVYNNYITQKNLISKYNIIEDGNKMKYVYLKLPNIFNSEVVGFPNDIQHQTFIEDNDIEKYVDYKKMFEGIVIKPLDPLISALDWNFEKKIKLTDFF